MAESPMKLEEGAERHKAGYKSWKKKYRKMRITFDQKMHECEDLHKQEAKALATVKRIAVENDRLLDILLEVNNSPQIPLEKRIDLSLSPVPESTASTLPAEPKTPDSEPKLKRLAQLLQDVPHLSYVAAKESQPSFIADLSPVDGEPYAASFLSADDIDNYIHAIDTRLESDKHFPTLAPDAHPESHPPAHPHLKNPTSVTNWLRKYAPKIFLQDGEGHAAAADGDDADHAASGGTGAKKSRGGQRAERGGRAAARGKRASMGVKVERGADWDASMDDDADAGATPVPKGKRKRDDDPGYKPRGSSSRPTKKKRKSEADSTPTVRKSKKEALASKED
ncbi:hypothetical protein S7711_00105 [Stachybotrys chartarum IBT 7711]|uniref:IEC3 subunit of the Ino80 complex, chromatin re-modelling-domain-containing protein n=1 Tax=Stachybotrys chartarum (strain CBS 109288 / IBT 7711) TaxID=1280523 RepID=A0A084B3G0_STACB|nr:hypothetical protein S7711_00105 [Stachybotrys chartarum IBT 7711]KFA52153.1 hypothetical protein S40293_00502 [Stachybotrys chartarum IBT 40293]